MLWQTKIVVPHTLHITQYILCTSSTHIQACIVRGCIPGAHSPLGLSRPLWSSGGCKRPDKLPWGWQAEGLLHSSDCFRKWPTCSLPLERRGKEPWRINNGTTLINCKNKRNAVWKTAHSTSRREEQEQINQIAHTHTNKHTHTHEN